MVKKLTGAWRMYSDIIFDFSWTFQISDPLFIAEITHTRNIPTRFQNILFCISKHLKNQKIQDVCFLLIQVVQKRLISPSFLFQKTHFYDGGILIFFGNMEISKHTLILSNQTYLSKTLEYGCIMFIFLGPKQSSPPSVFKKNAMVESW